MEYNFTVREKDGGFQVILSYKDYAGRWRQRSRQGYKTKREARAAGDLLLEEIKANVPVYIDRVDMTFGAFADRFLASVGRRFSFNTVLAYEAALGFFAPLRPLPLAGIKPADIEPLTLGRPYKPATVNTYISRLRTIFKAAMDQDLIAGNPAGKVKFLRVPADKKINALTAGRLEYILQDLERNRPDYFVMAALAAYAGLRVGEILGLQEDDIDYENSVLHIRHQLGTVSRNVQGMRVLKTAGSYRSVPAPQKLISILKRYGLNLAPKHRVINHYLKRYGDVHIHDLRHTYATRLLAEGFDIQTVAALLGDKVETVMQTYIHFTDDMREKARVRLFDLF